MSRQELVAVIVGGGVVIAFGGGVAVAGYMAITATRRQTNTADCRPPS